MDKLTICNNADVIDLVHRAINDASFFENKQIEIDKSFEKLIIHLHGDDFDSSITTGLMKGILALQDSLYGTYSRSVYGEYRRLTQEEKKSIELCVRIDPGSSMFSIDLDKITNAMAERIRRMTGKEILGTIAIVAVAVTLGLGTAKYIDSKTEIEKLRIHSDTITEVQKNTNVVLIGALESQSAFFRAVSKQNFDELNISGEDFSKAEVNEITKVTRERRPISTKLYSDDYLITDIHFENDAIYLDVVGTENKKVIKHVNIFKEHISTDDYQWFKDSTNQQAIKMSISATEKNNEIIAASLVSFSK